jgi:hypothetical protein
MPISYTFCEQAEQIAKHLIPLAHAHLQHNGVPCWWLFRRGAEWFRHGRPVLGDVQKLSPMHTTIATGQERGGGGFVFLFNHGCWNTLAIERKLRLVDHLLSRCDFDSHTGQMLLVEPDITLNEFSFIIERHGLDPDFYAQITAVMHSVQLELELGPVVSGSKPEVAFLPLDDERLAARLGFVAANRDPMRELALKLAPPPPLDRPPDELEDSVRAARAAALTEEPAPEHSGEESTL